MLTETKLINVKTLNKKLLKQITVLHLSDHSNITRMILEAFKASLLKPIGWINAVNMDGYMDGVKVWLLEYNHTLYLIDAPFGGHCEATPPWNQTCWQDLPQLFTL